MAAAADRADGARPPGRVARIAGTLGAVFLGGVLLVATAAKALDPAAFAAQVEGEGLAVLLPATAVALVALALEAFLGVALVLGVRRPSVLVPTALLVGFFLFLTGRAWWRDAHGTLPADAACGCFGNLVERTPAEAFVQDFLLLVPALLLAAFVGRPRAGAPARGRLAIAAVMATATAVFGYLAPDLPLDDLATRLRPGVAVAELCAGSIEDGTRECFDSVRVLPEAAEGEALVVLAELDEALGGRVAELNEYHWAASGPALYVVTAASAEELFQFKFGFGPAFEIREAPPALLRPLHRRLPRSFHVRDGVVVATWSGLPPLVAPARP